MRIDALDPLFISLGEDTKFFLPMTIQLPYVKGSGGIGPADYVFLFFFYSFVGYVMEATYRSLGYFVRHGSFKFINTGFLAGPICPIYGTGGTVFALFLTPFTDKLPIWVVLPLAMILADIVEYMTSFLMEKLFHMRWWDYTGQFMNLHGRICLKHTAYWALAAFIFIYIVHPVVLGQYLRVPEVLRNIALAVILAVFFADLISTVAAASDISKFMLKLEKLSYKVGLPSGKVKKIKYASVTDAQSFEESRAELAELKKQYESFKEDEKRIKASRRAKEVNRLLTLFEPVYSGAKKTLDAIREKIDPSGDKL